MNRSNGVIRRWEMGLAVVLCVLAGTGYLEALAEPPPEDSPTLVFVTDSGACDCVANLCVAGEQEVLNFLADNPWNFRRRTVDLAKTPGASKELGVFTVPVVFLRDVAGEQVARFDGFFAETDFRQAWKNHLREASQ